MPLGRLIFAGALGIFVGSLSGEYAYGQNQQADDSPNTSSDRVVQPGSFSIPVRIIEDPIEANARQSTEQHSRELSERGLFAQEGMNIATQSIKEATWFMFWVSIANAVLVAIGTGLLTWTLCLTRKATKSAENAVKVTRILGQKQVAATMEAVEAAQEANEVAWQQFKMGYKPRLNLNISGPYIDESRYPLSGFKDGETDRWTCIELQVEVENVGDQPATITGFFIRTLDPPFEIGNWEKIELWIDLPKGKRRNLTTNSHVFPEPPPGAELAHVGGFNLTPENRRQIVSHPPKVVGHIDYLDVLGIRRQMGFCVATLSVNGGGMRRLSDDEYSYDREI